MFSICILVSQLAGLLISGLDLPMVSKFDSSRAAYYGLALTVSNLLPIPFAAIVNTFIPVVKAIYAEQDRSRLGEVLTGTTRYANVFLGVLILYSKSVYLPCCTGGCDRITRSTSYPWQRS